MWPTEAALAAAPLLPPRLACRLRPPSPSLPCLPWLNYLFFAAGPIPEHLGHSTGPTADGQCFVFRGAAGADLFKFDYWQFSQSDLSADKAAN